MTIRDFVTDLALATFPGVKTRYLYPDIPKELYEHELPVQWVDMPAMTISPSANYGTFAESGVSYSAQLLIAVDEVTEGLPAEQRASVIEMAEQVELWMVGTIYTVELVTASRLPVGSREYRGVVARVTLTSLD